jgi:hypothetical protein
LNHEGYDAETTVNKKTFDDGDVVQELHEFWFQINKSNTRLKLKDDA